MSVVQTLADGSNKGKTEKRRAPSGHFPDCNSRTLLDA